MKSLWVIPATLLLVCIVVFVAALVVVGTMLNEVIIVPA